MPGNAWYDFSGRDVTSFAVVTARHLRHNAEGPLEMALTSDELNNGNVARVVYTYPTGRVELVELRFQPDQRLGACWAKRLVVEGSDEIYWASFSKLEYDRLTLCTIADEPSQDISGDDYCLFDEDSE